MGKVYGRYIVHPEDDITDRVGFRTVITSRGWMPSGSELSREQLDEEAPPPPEMPGGMLLIGVQNRKDGGGMRTWWTHEGVNGDGKSVTFKDRRNSLDWRFEPGYSQVSILKNARWPVLKAKFGGELLDGQVIWPDTIPGSTGGGFGASALAGKPNVMFGTDDFIRGDGTYLFRYGAFDADEAYAGVDRIHTNLPGPQPPRFPGRNWLKMMPAVVQRGLALDITESYALSGEGGWKEPLYGAMPTGAAGSGLTTGTLTTGSLRT